MFSALHSHSAFTLIELLVAVGLMAILLTMVATIFLQATQAFRVAKASVEIHRNARSAFDLMQRDLASAEFFSYTDTTGDTRGYFALSAETVTFPDGSSVIVPAITFTTLATQSGAVSRFPGVSPQVALVRYTLEADGGAAATARGFQPGSYSPVPGRPGLAHTYRLVKRVRFPALTSRPLDMTQFDPASLANETVTSERIAERVLTMRVRVQTGFWGAAETVSATTLTDLDRIASPNLLVTLPATRVAILDPPGSPQVQDIAGNTDSTITPAVGFTGTPGTDWRYYIDPAWYPLADPAALIDLHQRPPSLVEVTLEMTDSRAVRFHTLTERFYIPASER